MGFSGTEREEFNITVLLRIKFESLPFKSSKNQKIPVKNCDFKEILMLDDTKSFDF